MDVDRISELPEPILHNIISRISNTKEMARTSVFSKRWRSVWASFPNLDLQEKLHAPDIRACEIAYFLKDKERVREAFRKRDRFFNYVDDILSRRRQNQIRTHKFTICTTFPRDMSQASRMDQWIEDALATNAEELFLSFSLVSNFLYKLPDVLFASKTITVLTLNFCKIEPNGDIRLPFLQTLSLMNVYIQDHTFHKLLSSCPRIQCLDVMQCHGLENLLISSGKLKTVTMLLVWSPGLGKVEIISPFLQHLSIVGCNVRPRDIILPFCNYLHPHNVTCEIILTSCNYLQQVTLLGSNLGVTDKFVRDLLSKLPHLEKLVLSECSMLGNIEISNNRLKKFELGLCPSLVQVKIDAPNLLYFDFQGSIIETSILLINTSNHLEVILLLHVTELSNLWFVDLVDFFKNIDRCRVLTLNVLLEKAVVIPKELREELLPSLYNVKELKLIIDKPTTPEIALLVDSLLWICPCVETLSIEESRSDQKHLLFIYGDQMDSDEDPHCCRFHPRRCWRHFLREVNIVNFHEVVVEENLKEFFTQNAKTLKMVHISNREPQSPAKKKKIESHKSGIEEFIK